MKCFYHPQVDAVALCKNCSKGLCSACAVDVGNGVACKDRCEAEVKALNEAIQRGKSAHRKSGALCVRVAIFAGLAGLVFFVFGLFAEGALTWFCVSLALVLFLIAFFYYSASRRYLGSA
jgi:hypothetical protein